MLMFLKSINRNFFLLPNSATILSHACDTKSSVIGLMYFQNAKRGEVQASLNLFLETASGFYLQVSNSNATCMSEM